MELLRGQKPKRVAGDDGCAAAARTVFEAAMEDLDGGQPKVCLGLSASGWEPDEVDELAVVVLFVDGRGERDEEEAELERTPLWFAGFAASSGRRICRRIASIARANAVRRSVLVSCRQQLDAPGASGRETLGSFDDAIGDRCVGPERCRRGLCWVVTQVAKASTKESSARSTSTLRAVDLGEVVEFQSFASGVSSSKPMVSMAGTT